MLPATKHFDLVTGIDTHIVLLPTPAGPVPTPVPHPFVGIFFDPQDYVGGAKVFINGLPRAHAGTAVKATPPHIPTGGAFAKPPGNEGQLFMGSATVNADGEPMGYAALPVLTCQDIGTPAPFRPKKKVVAKSLFLPTSMAIPVPSGPPVLIGGPPTISMTMVEGAAKKAGAGLLAKALKKTKSGRKIMLKLKGAQRALAQAAERKVSRKLHANHANATRNVVRRDKCSVTGHPVEIATGKVFTDFVDLELAGPLPYKLERVWFSTSTYHGPLGHGWHASFDLALAEDAEVVGVRLADGRLALFPALEPRASHFNEVERLKLQRDDDGYRMIDAASGLRYLFLPRKQRDDLPLACIEDASGNALHFGYDRRGRLARIVDSGGRDWDLRYESDTRRLVQIEGPHPSVREQRAVYVQYGYDARENLVEVRDACGAAQSFVYKRHLLVEEKNRNGLSFYFQWGGSDEHARCLRTWGDSGIYDHKLMYDDLFKVTTVENSLGFKAQYEHDGAMVTRVIDAYGNMRVTEYGIGYRILAEVDELGQRTRYEYDERGNLVKSVSPDGATIELQYEDDLPVSAIDALGGTWSWTRDARGRVIARKHPLGEVTRYEYQGPRLVAVVDALGHCTRFAYDAGGNLDALRTPDHALTRFEHDRLGRVIAVTDPSGSVQRRAYDALGRVLRVHEPDGNERHFDLDAEGNVVRARDEQHDVRFTYVGMNRLASRTEAGTTVRFEYDSEEQLVAIRNEHGRVYRFKLGPTGEVDEEHGFDGLMRKYLRDKAGRVTRVERSGGRASDFVLDPVGRVTEVKHSDGSGETFQYRGDGTLVAAANEEGIVRFVRDALGRVQKEEFDGHSVESEHDARGLRIRMRSSLGADQHVTRNLAGDVDHVSETHSGFEVRFRRDMLGHELERTLPGGVRSRWERDRVGRPVAQFVEQISPSSLHTLRAVGYQWEVNDRLRRMVDGLNGATEYRHDALGNLAWARYPDGSYDLRMPDAVGNLFRTEHRGDREYGPAGQLHVAWTPAGSTHYAYDPEGNLVAKREPSGATWRYQWSASGLLRKVIRPDGTEVTFGYDALGRRVKKTFRGQTTRWIWDGNVPLHEWVHGRLQSLAELDAAPFIPFVADPATKRREAELDALLAQGPPARGSRDKPITWLFEPESFAPMAKLVADVQQSIICDHLGTPVLMVDDCGERVWSASIDVYGTMRGVAGERWACPFRWPGQYEDAETGLYYNRFRYYDTEAGQYTSQDPIGLAGGAAPYGYVHDPLAWVDPLGLSRRPWLLTDEHTNAKRVIGKRTYYRHRTTELWWSRDTAGHGGSAFKVFKEGPGGDLDWYRDADGFGDFIDPDKKHKGPKGKKVCGS